MEDLNESIEDIRFELKTVLGLVIFNMILFLFCLIFLFVILYSR